MDTNNLSIKFKAKLLDIEKLERLIGLSDSKDSIEVETSIGTVKVPENNKIDLGVRWINEIKLLQNNTLKVVISYPKYFGKNNSITISSQGEIERVQKELVEIIEKELGAKVDLKNTIHTRIDYPINIEKIADFRDWRNVFILIAKATNNEDDVLFYGVDQKNKKLYSKGILVRAGRELDINFYNQRENIKRKTGEDIGKEVLRVETRLKSDKVIKKYLGTNKIKEVKLKDIKEVSREIIQNEVLDKLVKELEEQKDFLARELKDYRKRIRNNYIKSFVEKYQSRIFDYELLELAIDRLEVAPRTKRMYKAQARETLQELEEISDFDIKYFDNFSRINFMCWKLLGKEFKDYNIKAQIKK